MPKESLQKKVGRVRPPRVQITYDVQVGDAIEKRDLPFVVGVLADLSGMPEKALPPISKRKFVAVDRDKLLQAAQKFVEKKRYDKAILEYQKLVAEDPKDARTLLKIGDLYLKLE